MTEIERIRLQAAEGIMLSFDKALDKLSEQDTQVGELRGLLEELQHKRQGIRHALQGLRNSLDTLERNVGNQLDTPLPDEVASPIKWAREALDRVETQMTQARAIADKLLALEVDRNRLSHRRERLHRHVKVQMVTHAQTNGSWKGLQEYNDSWNEGLDFISGLCIRRAGLDRGLCQIADQIISEVRWTGVEAMAVPGRGGPGFVTQIIHLRLPNWSVWSLPLTAHELWHLGVNDSIIPGKKPTVNHVLYAMLEHGGESAQEMEQEAEMIWTDSEFQLCMADVFGTVVMGPAYANACIALALDPTSPVAEQRALAMFRTLRSIPEFIPAEEDLRKAWSQVCQGTAGLKYEKWIDLQLKYLHDAASEFLVERWKEWRSDLVDALRTGNIEAFAKSGIQVRYVLGAAWKARNEFAQQEDKIMGSTVELCHRLISAKGTQTPGAQGSAPIW